MVNQSRKESVRALAAGVHIDGADALASGGIEVTSVGSGERALVLLETHSFDIALADVALPGMSGFEFCSLIRERSDLPVIFLTAALGVADKLRGFNAGADDYIVTPVDGEEVRMRVRAILRRCAPRSESEDALEGPGDLVLRQRAHDVAVNGDGIELTPKEFDVLRLLLLRRGEVLRTDTISQEIWGYETFGSQNFVQAHVSRLRAKLQQAGSSAVVSTVRGVGYVIR